MPLFDFRCPECGYTVKDIVLSLKELVQVRECACPKCNIPMKRVTAVPAVQFKGSGWTPKFHSRK